MSEAMHPFRESELLDTPGGPSCRRCRRPVQPGERFCGGCGLRLRGRNVQDLSGFVRAMRFGRRLRQRGKAWYPLALRSFAEARNLRRDDVEPILEIARTYHMMDEPFAARRWYRRAIRRQRDCVEAWIEGAGTYAKGQDFHRARWLRGAAARRPDDKELSDAFAHHLDRLTGWQRRWVEHRYWRQRGKAMDGSEQQVC